MGCWSIVFWVVRGASQCFLYCDVGIYQILAVEIGRISWCLRVSFLEYRMPDPYSLFLLKYIQRASSVSFNIASPQSRLQPDKSLQRNSDTTHIFSYLT